MSVIPGAAITSVVLTMRISYNRFELSLHPAKRYRPSMSNSTEVISPKHGDIVCIHMPPTASHIRICLSFDLLCSVKRYIHLQAE